MTVKQIYIFFVYIYKKNFDGLKVKKVLSHSSLKKVYS